jgi:hypothetical protein
VRSFVRWSSAPLSFASTTTSTRPRATLSPHHVLLLQPLLVDNVELCCIALDLLASHHWFSAKQLGEQAHTDAITAVLNELVHEPRTFLSGLCASPETPYRLAVRHHQPPIVDRHRHRLDQRAVQQRLLLVSMEASPEKTSLAFCD